MISDRLPRLDGPIGWLAWLAWLNSLSDGMTSSLAFLNSLTDWIGLAGWLLAGSPGWLALLAGWPDCLGGLLGWLAGCPGLTGSFSGQTWLAWPSDPIGWLTIAGWLFGFLVD